MYLCMKERREDLEVDENSKIGFGNKVWLGLVSCLNLILYGLVICEIILWVILCGISNCVFIVFGMKPPMLYSSL